MKEKIKIMTSTFILMFFCLIAGGSIITGNPYEIYVWIGLFVAIFIIALVVSIKRTNKRHDVIQGMKSNSNFKVSSEITSDDAKFWVGISNESEQIKIVNLQSNGEKSSEDLIEFSNIISVELLEDGKTTYSKSTIRTIGGAALGGVLAGGAGVIVGGLSGNTNVKNEISKIEVKLLLRDYKKSSIIVSFYSDSEIEKGGLIYNLAHTNAMQLIDEIKVIIDKADREYAQTHINNNQPIDVSQEIERLYDLKVRGIISEEEFRKLKERHINNNK